MNFCKWHLVSEFVTCDISRALVSQTKLCPEETNVAVAHLIDSMLD